MKAPRLPATVAGMDYRTAAVLIGGAVLVYFLAKREIGKAAVAVGGAVNPISSGNLAARAVNAVVSVADGDTATGPASLGDLVFKKLHPAEYDRLRRAGVKR